MSVEMINQLAGAILGASIAVVVAGLIKTKATDEEY